MTEENERFFLARHSLRLQALAKAGLSSVALAKAKATLKRTKNFGTSDVVNFIIEHRRTVLLVVSVILAFARDSSLRSE
jgi:hypothetical protein